MFDLDIQYMITVSGSVCVCVCVCVCVYWLQQGLGLAVGVVRAEVLVLLHLLLQGQQLALHLAAQRGQRVPDVVCELLRGAMEVWKFNLNCIF